MNTKLIKPSYGYDAPGVIKRFALYGVLALLMTISAITLLPSSWVSSLIIFFLVLMTIFFFFPIVTILLGSLYYKFRERDWLFSHVSLNGNENVLDVGCGRGLLLVRAAKYLESGKAHGLDLWVQADQAYNFKEATIKNAKLEGVDNKIEIHTGDMQAMPFPDASMDTIISSWAIHNIYNQTGREKVLAEILRVLKPGGRIAILDIDHAPSYNAYFIKNGLEDVKLLGPRYTFGNKTYLVLAKKTSLK